MGYEAADCSGAAESVSLDLGGAIVCDGQLCSYGVAKTFGGGAEEGECTEAFEEEAVFINRCAGIVGFGSSIATCSGSSGSYSSYTSADCSGTAVDTEDIGDDACSSIIECNEFGSSSASVPATLLAMVISA